MITEQNAKRTISIKELKDIGEEHQFIKDNSIRGFRSVFTNEVKPGDQVIIDSYFATVTD